MEQDEPMNAQRRGALSQSGSGTDPSPPSIGDPVTSGLQQLFASIADEPIPEDFLRLLDEIEARAANDDHRSTEERSTGERSTGERSNGERGTAERSGEATRDDGTGKPE